MVNSDLKAIVDAEDFLRLSRFRWYVTFAGRRYPCIFRKNQNETLTLARVITGAQRCIKVRYLNGNRLDCRRTNLCASGGSIRADRHSPHSKRARNLVFISIDNRAYYLGRWPAREIADYVREAASEEARSLRARKLSHEAVRRALELATGRGLLGFAASVLPNGLPSEVREDAMQAICLDLIAGNIEAGELKRRRVINRYISDARGLNDHFRFISTDAPIGDTDLTVGDRLVA